MRFKETCLEGAFIITLEPISDERGYFARHYCEREMTQHGLQSRFVQCNVSRNNRRGTIRGLHYQLVPYSESKVVSCLKGAIFDVIVDLRKSSSTYGEWYGVELSSDNQQAIYIPPGFAHGYQTLSDDTELLYLMGNYYHEAAARGIRWDDSTLEIAWPLDMTIISSRDEHFPDFLNHE